MADQTGSHSAEEFAAKYPPFDSTDESEKRDGCIPKEIKRRLRCTKQKSFSKRLRKEHQYNPIAINALELKQAIETSDVVQTAIRAIVVAGTAVAGTAVAGTAGASPAPSPSQHGEPASSPMTSVPAATQLPPDWQQAIHAAMQASVAPLAAQLQTLQTTVATLATRAELQTLQTTLATLATRAELQALQTTVATLATRAELQAALERSSNKTLQQIRNQEIRAANRLMEGSPQQAAPWRPIIREDGLPEDEWQTPPSFPSSTTVLKAMSKSALTALLQFYLVAVDEMTVADMRARLLQMFTGRK